MSLLPSEEDAEVVRRITRAEPLVVHQIDVDNMDPARADSFLKEIKDRLKDFRKRAPNTPLQEFANRVLAEDDWSEDEIKAWERRFGRLELRFNPLDPAHDDDFWLPRRA